MDDMMGVKFNTKEGLLWLRSIGRPLDRGQSEGNRGRDMLCDGTMVGGSPPQRPPFAEQWQAAGSVVLRCGMRRAAGCASGLNQTLLVQWAILGHAAAVWAERSPRPRYMPPLGLTTMGWEGPEAW